MKIKNFKISIITTSDVDGDLVNDTCRKLERDFFAIIKEFDFNVQIEIMGFYVIIMDDEEMIESFSKGKAGCKKVKDLHTGDQLRYLTIPVTFVSSFISNMNHQQLTNVILHSVANYCCTEKRGLKAYSTAIETLRSAALEIMRAIGAPVGLSESIE